MLGLAGTFLLLIAYNAVSGLRDDDQPAEVLIDSVEELGIGLTVSAGVLFMLARIDFAMPPIEIVGKVVVEGMLVAIGVSIGRAQLHGGDPEAEGQGAPARSSGRRRVSHGTANVVVFSLCGAVLLAANVAPTEEIAVLGAHLSPERLLVTMAVSLGIAAVTLFFSEFHGSHRLRTNRGMREIVLACLIAYSVALLTSAGLLWFFGRFDGTSVAVMLGETVVLAFPATLGAAAGRLLLN
jgi:putative integral membrane protein (TIGR02587 family)